VSLRDIADSLGIQPEDSTHYLDRETGEIIWVPDEGVQLVEDDEPIDSHPDWEPKELEVIRKILEDSEGRFVALPSNFDVHEYRIMEDFCHSVKDEALSDLLLRAIKGSGAFRRFKNLIDDRGIAEQWYAFQANALKEIAREWCELNGIAYTDE
jgi:hypothetical protein